MEDSILKIVKDKDDFANVVEIKANAKGEPHLSVKTRSDVSAKDAGDRALVEYKRIRRELLKE